MYITRRKTGGANRLVDLRSDTVTRPTEAMREAMAHAEVGDDVYGDDPTVNALEEKTADMLGKEAALFVTSGTQSNLAALLSHCGRGDEYIGGVDYHIPKYEAAGAAVLGGISPKHLQLNDRGGLNAADVEAAIQPDDCHFAITRLVCLENTYNGLVMDQDEIERTAEVTKRHGLGLHIDGARLMNAAVFSATPARDLVACADTVSLCLSKGLGAPVGSVLCGPEVLIDKARRARKMLGGGLRQSGILAAAGLYALDNHIDRLAEDHENALKLARRLSEIEGIEIDPDRVHTNMIWLNVHEGKRKEKGKSKGNESLGQHMAKRGIVVSDPAGPDGAMRLVTHLDFTESDIDRVVEGFADWHGKTGSMTGGTKDSKKRSKTENRTGGTRGGTAS